MSQAAKQIIGILLGVLLVVAIGFCLILSLNNKKISLENSTLKQDVEQYRSRESKLAVELNDWKGKFNLVEKEKNDLAAKINNAGGNLEELSLKVKDLVRERDDLKLRFDTMQKERDSMTAKLEESSKALSAAMVKTTQVGNIQQDAAGQASQDESAKSVSPDDEDYWARILKEKAALQMDVEKTKDELAQSELLISDLKKQSSDLQMEISKLNTDKEAITREIKYGNDLAKSLSIELARSQGEKQFMTDRMNKISEENNSLHDQLKSLTATKVALEKSIVKLQGDKKDIQNKLLETEGVIQSRVNQIYELKDTLAKDFKPATKNPRTGEIELSPIVVNSSDKNATEIKSTPAGVSGKVVSVNDENNFIIVDLGQDSGIKIGEKLNVYRGATYIAGLEVIQVRKDILAADIKNKVVAIEVGDSVK